MSSVNKVTTRTVAPERVGVALTPREKQHRREGLRTVVEHTANWSAALLSICTPEYLAAVEVPQAEMEELAEVLGRAAAGIRKVRRTLRRR